MAVDPTGKDLAEFLAGGPDSPVVMLNLLRFADGGRDSYARYATPSRRRSRRATG